MSRPYPEGLPRPEAIVEDRVWLDADEEPRLVSHEQIASIAMLEALRWADPGAHYECEDPWYSCPEHTSYIGDRQGCECQHGRIQAAIAALEGR